MADETKHSPEPWRLLPGTVRHVEAADGTWVTDIDHDTSEADGRRILACVNACAGVPTTALEAGALAKVLEAAVYVAKEFWRIDGADGSGGYDAEKDLRRALRALGK